MQKKKITLLLTTILAALSTVGCSGKSSDSTPPSTENTATAVSETKEEPSSATASSEVPPLKGPGNVTLSFLGFSLDFDPNSDVMADVIEKTTGYQVEYSMLPSDGADEKLIADVAGGVN